MLYREIIAVCSQIHAKHINTLCGQNVELLNVKLAVHIVITGLYNNEFFMSGVGHLFKGSVVLLVTNSNVSSECTVYLPVKYVPDFTVRYLWRLRFEGLNFSGHYYWRKPQTDVEFAFYASVFAENFVAILILHGAVSAPWPIWTWNWERKSLWFHRDSNP
jgi:hypothetical protein